LARRNVSGQASGISSRWNSAKEGHRPPAFREQERQQILFIVAQDRDLLGQRDFDRALLPLLQRVCIGLQLVVAGVAAGQRARPDTPYAGSGRSVETEYAPASTASPISA